MGDYYIYVLEIENAQGTKYYVGKTLKLFKRMKDHFNGNNKSAKKIIDDKYKVKKLKCLIRIDDSNEISDECTSKIENEIARKMIIELGISNVRGGCYLSPWNDNNFKLLSKIPIKKKLIQESYNKNMINILFFRNRAQKKNLSINDFKVLNKKNT